MASAREGSPMRSCHWVGGMLARDDRGAAAVAILENLEQVAALLILRRGEAPVVEEQHVVLEAPMSLPRVRSRWTACGEPSPRSSRTFGMAPSNEVPHDGGPALVVQLAGGDAFKRSLRHRRRLHKGVEDLGEPGVTACPFLDLASERSQAGRHSRIPPESGAIETIETQRSPRS